MKKETLREVGTGVSSALYISAFALACCACAGISAVTALLVCAAAQLFLLKSDSGIFTPDAFALLAMLYAFKCGGASSAALSILTALAVYLLMRAVFRGRAGDMFASVRPGLIMCFALCGTVLFTTDYFGIGASGADVTDMLSSYRSLGFHPNFRGLLPGTITLVLMITYPRKFKRLKGHIPTAFAALLVPSVLMALLYGDAAFSPLNELSSLASAPDTGSLIPLGLLTAADIPCAVLTGVGTAAYLFMREKGGAPQLVAGNLLAAAASPILLVRTDYPENMRQSPVSRVTAFAVLALSAVLSPYIFARIPIHSLAVVLIASLWHAVPWGELVRSLKNGAALIIIIIGIALNIPAAVLVAFIIAVLGTFRLERRAARG